MNIQILHLIEGAKIATGLTVIIDVFRAFSTACYVFNNNAYNIIPVGDIEIAYRLKDENPEYILMGERGGKIRPGFDYGNSPTHIENIDFTDKTIIHTTSAGTQGLTKATQADEIITGGFVNAGAIIRYIRFKNPDQVSFVAMGEAGLKMNDEDLLCAEYLKNSLENKPTDFNKIVNHLKTYKTSYKFLNHEVKWAPKRDFELCLSINRFDFVLQVKQYNESMIHLSKNMC